MSRKCRPASSPSSGGYSTADGFIAEVSVGDRNLLGHGQYAKASACNTASTLAAFNSRICRAVSSWAIGMAGGIDIYAGRPWRLELCTPTTTEPSATQFAPRLCAERRVRHAVALQSFTSRASRCPTSCNNVDPNSNNGTYPTNVAGTNPATGMTWVDPATGGTFADKLLCRWRGLARGTARALAGRGAGFTSRL